MHRLAERAGFMTSVLRGEMARDRYATYLRNLHAIYDPLERELARLALSPAPPAWIIEPVFRRASLEADLACLQGPRWPEIPLAPAAQAYARRLGALPQEGPHRLAAHAYVRYLGDLSGGQAIRAVVGRAYGLGEEGTAFYDFGADPGPERLKARLREGLDAYGEFVGASRAGEIVEEAVEAFARHRALFGELQAAG